MTETGPPTEPTVASDGYHRVGLALVGLLVAGFVVPVVIAANAGALGIPRSDDWSYLVTLFRWSDQGTLNFNHWVSMTLIGQLVLARPVVAIFGNSIRAVQVFSAVIGLGGLGALVVLGYEVLPRRRGAWLVAFTIALGPLWAPLAATYMSDVPAFAFEMGSLAAAAVAFRRRSFGWLVTSVALGFVGFSIRQYGAIPVVAILAVALWDARQRSDRGAIRRILGLGVVTGIACGMLLAWWSTIPDPLPVAPSTPTFGTAIATGVNLAGFLRLTGLLMVPVIVWVGPFGVVRRAWASSRSLTVLLGGGSAALLVASLLRESAVPFVGNYVSRYGVLANDVVTGVRPDVIPAWLFDLMVVVGTAGGAVLVLAVVPALAEVPDRLRRRDVALRSPMTAVMTLTLIGFAVAYGFAVLTDLPIFDRYALPVLPLAALLLIRSTPPVEAATSVRSGRGLVAVATLIGLGVVGLGFATDSASFDATRWEVAERAAAKGFGPLHVYGGFEWVAYHRKVGPLQGDTATERQRLRALHFQHLCVTVIVNPGPRMRRTPIATGTSHALLHGPVRVVAVRNDTPC